MILEEALYTYLTTDNTVSGLIGTRLYPEMLPEGVALPAMAYQRISRDGLIAHDGPTGLATVRMQLTLLAASYLTLRTLAEAVRVLFDGKRQTIGGEGGVVVHESYVDNDFGSFAELSDAMGRYVDRMDIILLHEE